MEKKTVKSMGVNYTVDVPTSVEEYDQLAKVTGACLASAIDNEIYRGCNQQFRKAYLAALITRTGIKREQVPDPSGKLNEDKTPKLVYKNSEGKDIDLIIAQANVSEADQQAIADEISGSKAEDGNPVIVFDPSEREKKEREASIGKGDLDMAAQLIAQGPDGLAKSIKKLVKTLGKDVVLPGDGGEGDKKALALAIKEFRTSVASTLKA